MSKQLPLRPIGRVLIVKNNLVCMGQVFDKNGKLEYYTFPGGGNDDGSTLEEVCRRESLEEVGMVIGNIQPLGLEVPAEHKLGKKRDHLFRGTHTTYYKADFSSYDKTLHGSEGDALSYSWETPIAAIKKVEASPANMFNAVRIAALKLLMEKEIRSTKVWSW